MVKDRNPISCIHVTLVPDHKFPINCGSQHGWKNSFRFQAGLEPGTLCFSIMVLDHPTIPACYGPYVVVFWTLSRLVLVRKGCDAAFLLYTQSNMVEQAVTCSCVHQSPGHRACRVQLTSLFDLFKVQSCHSS